MNDIIATTLSQTLA